MNKNQAKKWLLEAGFTSSYSGNTRTLYVHGISQKELDYYNLPVNFSVKAD